MKTFDVGQLTGAQATLLMPLWARALEARRSDALLRDRKAVEIVESLDFDFEDFARKRVSAADYCIRSSIIDCLVRDHLQTEPAANVVEFGVGLDTRFDRLDNGQVCWTEMDLPGAITLRRQFFDESQRRAMISGSLLETGWMEAAKRRGKGPALFVAEGVLYFLSKPEVRELFIRLADHFPGSAFVFDAQSPLFLRLSNLRHPLSTSRLRFALGRNAAEIEGWDPRLRVEHYVGFGDPPYYDRARRRLGWAKRLALLARPVTRHAFKVVQVRFG